MATTAAGVAADEELIRQAVHGDRDAFAEIYRRYHQVVFRFARMMSGSQTLAEDVTQEVFVSLLKDPGRYDPQRAVLSTYLYGMARNLTRGHLRQRGRFVELSDDAYGRGEAGMSGDQSEVMIAVQTREKLRAVIATLPSRYREAVILCDVHGLSYADAAIVIGRPVGTLRSRLHRARALIEERMLEQPSSLGTLARARCIA